MPYHVPSIFQTLSYRILSITRTRMFYYSQFTDKKAEATEVEPQLELGSFTGLTGSWYQTLC